MKTRIYRFAKFAVLVTLVLSNGIFAQDTVRYRVNQLDSVEYARGIKKYPKFKVYIFTGGLFSNIDGNVIVNDKILGAGTKLDFEDNLKLDKDIFTYRLGAIYNLSDKSFFTANFFGHNRTSSITLKDTVQFGGYRFNGNAKFNFELDFTYLGLNYTYNFVSKPQYTAGATAGIRLFNYSVSASGMATVDSQSTEKTSDNKLLAPGILLGLNYSVYFLPRLLNRSSVEYFSVKVGSITATLFEAKLGLEYYFFKNVGIGLLAMANILKIVSDSEEDFNGEVSYNFKGLSLYAAIRF